MTGIDENGSIEDEDHHLVENGETRGKIVKKHMEIGIACKMRRKAYTIFREGEGF